MIIYFKIYIIDIQANIKNEFYKDKFKINYKNNSKLEIISNKWLLPNIYLVKHSIIKNTTSIIKFDIIYFRLLANLIVIIIN